MLGNYEKRRFANGEKVWVGRYKNLTNVLHWHFECEIISVVCGNAKIKIGPALFEASKGDSFFCREEELHYIISEPESVIDIMIFDKSIAKDITGKYTLTMPLLLKSIPISQYAKDMEKLLSTKGMLYREALEIKARSLIIEIFRGCETTKCSTDSVFYKELISKINDEFGFITFEDAVKYSGYSPSHFSKLFKRLSGMNFSEYLNIIRVENAIEIMRNEPSATMTSISLKCGFSTVRNFNRVFKDITGYSPRLLPKDFILDTGMRISHGYDFDPTHESSRLI